jgi:hypothetical protein
MFHNANLSLEFHNKLKRRSCETGLSYYFPSRIDDFSALLPNLTSARYRGYGSDLTLKRFFPTKKGAAYWGGKLTFKYKYFNNTDILVGGKPGESYGAIYTNASNKRFAESACAMIGVLANRKSIYWDLYLALGISYISNSTKNHYTYVVGENYDPPLILINNSNRSFWFPEFQFGFKVGLGLKGRNTKVKKG